MDDSLSPPNSSICAAGFCAYCGCEFRRPTDVVYHRCAAMQEAEDEEETMVTKIKGGRSVDDFLEHEAGGVYHKAVILADLGSAVYTARKEWEYDESEAGVLLTQLCTALDDYLRDLSIMPDGELTRYRECSRCGGEGGFKDEPTCNECGGVGSVHASEADG